MRTTISLDDELLAKAREFGAPGETNALVREAIKIYIELQASRRLAALGGSMPGLEEEIPRRRAGSPSSS